MRENVPEIEIHDRCVEQQTVEQIKDAADAGEEVSRIFHACLALEQRLNQVADHRRRTQDDAKNYRMERRHARHLVRETL